jgi:LysR family transcriptional regulator for metE and metH
MMDIAIPSIQRVFVINHMNGSHIELRHLRLLQAVHDTGGMTAAAERLFLTQSAVSHQLKALEQALGLPLVERSSRPVRLTVAGKRLLRLAQAILPEVETALRDLAKLRDGDAGELRIAVECHTCYDWLMPAMDAFREAWPKVELDIVGGFHPNPLELLAEGRADFVVTSEAAPQGVKRFPLFSYETVALLAHGHPLTGKKWLDAGDFAQQTLITYPVPDHRLDLLRRVLLPAGIKPARRDAVLTVAILQLVASQRGIAALPAWSVAAYLERDYVTARPVTETGLWGELHAAVREPDSNHVFLLDFIKTVKNHCAGQLPGIRLLPGYDPAASSPNQALHSDASQVARQ